MTTSSMDQMRSLETLLQAEIRGQNHLIPRIASVLRRGELGLSKPGRPKGSFLFLGPTGVGKTEMAQCFTRILFGSQALVRFDMSEFQNQETVGLLLGSKLGEAGLLGQALVGRATGTILFDEVEKAHPRILDLFLQILDAARITLATGETLDLSGFYVVMTSNIGSAELLSLQYATESTLERHVLARAQEVLRPEIFARITEKLVFHRLSYEHQLPIAEKFLREELAFLASRGIHLTADETVLPFLVRKGFHPKLGARPMRDTVEKMVGDAVGERVLDRNRLPSGLVMIEMDECLTVTSIERSVTRKFPLEDGCPRSGNTAASAESQAHGLLQVLTQSQPVITGEHWSLLEIGKTRVRVDCE